MRANYVKSMNTNICIGSSGDNFRVFLYNDEKNNKWLNTVLVISRGFNNPMEYGREFYELVENFLAEQGLNIWSCNLYLDLLEYLGIENDYLFKWVISKKTSNWVSKLNPVNPDELDDEKHMVIRAYYEDKWSVLKESTLSNDEKGIIINQFWTDTCSNELCDDTFNSSVRYTFRDSLDKKSVCKR